MKLTDDPAIVLTAAMASGEHTTLEAWNRTTEADRFFDTEVATSVLTAIQPHHDRLLAAAVAERDATIARLGAEVEEWKAKAAEKYDTVWEANESLNAKAEAAWAEVERLSKDREALISAACLVVSQPHAGRALRESYANKLRQVVEPMLARDNAAIGDAP